MTEEKAARDLALESFDTFQRMSVIQRVCEHLSARGCETAIDVGGHPGLLARHLRPLFRQVHAVDLPRCDCPSYLQGSALDLPLQSRSVDVAVCADVLEHVRDPERAVREIHRVAKRAVVISAPWRSDATDRVEKRLVEWHRMLTGEDHPWLAEHRECGLPDRDAVFGALEEAGWATTELACGNLTEWALLQFGLLVREIMPEGDVNFDAINEALNRSWPEGLSTQIPAAPYRTVIVAAGERTLIDGMAQGDPQESSTPALLTALPLLDSHLRSILALTASSESESQPFDEAYCERLEALTRQQAAEIEALRQQLSEASPSALSRILRRVRAPFTDE